MSTFWPQYVSFTLELDDLAVIINYFSSSLVLLFDLVIIKSKTDKSIPLCHQPLRQLRLGKSVLMPCL